VTAVDLHHVVGGRTEGPVVLMLGSLGSTLDMWDAQAAALSGRYRVVRADLRGHGGSPVPPGPYAIDDLVDDAVALLDRLGVEWAHVVGLSLGAMTAMRLAARHPERVGRLALLCTSPLLGPESRWTERAATVRAEGTAAVAKAGVERWFTPERRAADPELVARHEAMIASIPAEGYAGCCEAIGSMDLLADLPRITAPTLAIAGADDPATPPEHLAAIAAGVPGAQYLMLPRAAHLAAVEQADAVNVALTLHLGGDDAGSDVGVGGGDRSDAARRQAGMATRRAVLGDAHVDRAVAGTTPFTAGFQDFITRTAWGDVWNRPGLSRRDRSVVTLTALVALGHENELEMHVRAALTNGLSPEEIGEVILHTAIYAGVPAANSAFARAARVVAEAREE
jgi:3-oxoadipate enol-lactonase/4-carboxymuconolactone decarboxylase